VLRAAMPQPSSPSLVLCHPNPTPPASSSSVNKIPARSKASCIRCRNVASDVKNAMRLRHRQAFDRAGVCLLHGGERRSRASVWCAVRGRWDRRIYRRPPGSGRPRSNASKKANTSQGRRAAAALVGVRVTPVTLAACYRHAPLDVARPQPDVVPAEWPHAAAHSEPRPWAAVRPQAA
jgi:hypothetical protein